MPNDKAILPVEHNMDLNLLLAKDYKTEHPEESRLHLFRLTSPYSDMDNICSIIVQPTRDMGKHYTYTALHLNIRTLSAII